MMDFNPYAPPHAALELVQPVDSPANQVRPIFRVLSLGVGALMLLTAVVQITSGPSAFGQWGVLLCQMFMGAMFFSIGLVGSTSSDPTAPLM